MSACFEEREFQSPPDTRTRTVLPPPMQPETNRANVLEQLRSGGRAALDAVTALLYEELREIARRHRRNGDHTLPTTAIVHEAYLKLVDQTEARWTDRAHFLALAAVAMRHVLIDRARAKNTAKRGAGEIVTFEDELVAVDDHRASLLEIDEALGRLSKIDERLARVVECRFFGGLTHEEIAEVLGVTVRTVERDWAKARMLLRADLSA